MQEEQVDVGVREEPAAPVASCSNESEALQGARCALVSGAGGCNAVRGNDDLVPERPAGGIDEFGAMSDGTAAIGIEGKFFLDRSRLPGVEVSQLGVDGGRGGHRECGIVVSTSEAIRWRLLVTPQIWPLSNPHAYKTFSPRSSLRMRIASSIRERKILPSPILPVRAALAIACTAFSTASSARTISSFTFGIKSTEYSRPR